MNYFNELAEKGVFHIPNIVDENLCFEAVSVIEKYITENNNSDLLKTANGTPRKLCYAFEKSDVFLQIISCPRLIELIKQINPNHNDIVPTWEDILIKCPHNGIPVEIHQDLGLQTINQGNVFSFAIYLTESSDNPVYYLEGSQKLGALTRDEIKTYSDTILYQPVIAQTTDVVIHNVLTLHYSDINSSDTRRYTWYIEFRTMPQLINDSPWNKEWGLKRQAIMYHAIEMRKKMGLPYQELYSKEYIDSNLRDLPISLKVPHLIEGVKYEDNDYNHFLDHKTLF